MTGDSIKVTDKAIEAMLEVPEDRREMIILGREGGVQFSLAALLRAAVTARGDEGEEGVRTTHLDSLSETTASLKAISSIIEEIGAASSEAETAISSYTDALTLALQPPSPLDLFDAYSPGRGVDAAFERRVRAWPRPEPRAPRRWGTKERRPPSNRKAKRQQARKSRKKNRGK